MLPKTSYLQTTFSRSQKARKSNLRFRFVYFIQEGIRNPLSIKQTLSNVLFFILNPIRTKDSPGPDNKPISVSTFPAPMFMIFITPTIRMNNIHRLTDCGLIGAAATILKQQATHHGIRHGELSTYIPEQDDSHNQSNTRPRCQEQDPR